MQRDWLRKQLRSLHDVKATHRTRLAVKRLRYRLGPLLAATATTMAVTSVPSTVISRSVRTEIGFTSRRESLPAKTGRISMPPVIPAT